MLDVLIDRLSKDPDLIDRLSKNPDMVYGIVESPDCGCIPPGYCHCGDGPPMSYRIKSSSISNFWMIYSIGLTLLLFVSLLLLVYRNYRKAKSLRKAQKPNN